MREIREPNGEGEWEAYYAMRWEVLRKPLGMGEATSRDAEDGSAWHLAAFEGGRLVGAGRLHRIGEDLGQVRYMAVAPAFAGRGIGRELLEGLLAVARREGMRRVELNAREAVADFYRKSGFGEMEGGRLLLHGLPHLRMEKDLKVEEEGVG